MIRIVTVVALLTVLIAPSLAQQTSPVDEDAIHREIADLQDRTGTIDPAMAQQANKLLAKGVKAHDRHEYEKALAFYRKALEQNPIHATAHYEIAMTLTSMGENAEALEHVIRAIALDPKQEIAYVLKGSLEDDLGFPEDALVTYDRLLEINPESYMGLLNKAITLMKRGDYAETEALLHRAREVHPEHPSAYLRLAQVARLQDFNYDEIDYLERFVELGAQDPRVEGVRTRLAELRQNEIQMAVDAPYADIDLMFDMARMLWKTKTHRETFPEARGYRLTFEEQQAVLQELLLELWREKKLSDPDATHDYYDFLLKIDNAGFFEEFAYHQGQRELGPVAQQWVAAHPERIEAFLDWAKSEGLTNDDEDDGAAEASHDPAPDENEDTIVLDEHDLPGFVFTVLEESELTYEIDVTTDDTPDYFADEASRWRRFRFSGEDRADCGIDVRAEVEQAYDDHAAPLRTWVRCFDPADEQWSEVRMVSRFGMRYHDLSPTLLGLIENRDGTIRVLIDPERPGWMAYLLFKAAWPREPMLRRIAERAGPEPILAEEVLALTTVIAVYQNSLEPEDGEEPGVPDPYMEELQAIKDADMLRAFAAFEILHKRYGVSLRRLEPDLADELDRYLDRFVFRLAGESGS